MRNLSLILLIMLIMFSILPAYSDAQPGSIIPFSENKTENTELPYILVESPFSYAKTVMNLKKAINGRNYRLIRIQKLDQGYTDKNKESDDLVVYFCNFNLVNKAIKKDSRIGQFLPCRITVIERDGKVYLIAINPKSIGGFLSNSSLKQTCTEVSNMYRDIMDEVTI